MSDLVQVFKALANEHRLAIFLLLREACCVIAPGEECPPSLDRNALTVNAIVARLHITQATVSHHLKELANAGLLVRRKVGQHVYYLINTETVDALQAFFQQQPVEGGHDHDWMLQLSSTARAESPGKP